MPSSPLAIVGDDGSDTAARAVDWTERLARRIDLDLSVMSAVAPGEDHAPEVDYRAQLVSGDPRQVIPATATAEDAALTVLARHDAHRGARPRLGSVTEHVAAHSTNPVVVVPPDGASLTDGPVVVGVDGSDRSRTALAWAVRFAAALGVPLTAALCYDPLADSFPHPPTATEWQHSAVPGVADAMRSLDTEVVVETVAVPADPGPGLREVADSVDAPMIAVGAAGSGAIKQWILGSTTLELLHHSTRPVAVVPGPGQ